MYTEAVYNELFKIKERLRKEISSLGQSISVLKTTSDIYGYHYIPDYYPGGKEVKKHPGRNLMDVYKIYDIKQLAKAIQKDVNEDRLTNLRYLDYLFIPQMKFADQIAYNVQFDLIAIDYWLYSGSTENPKSVTFQMHRADIFSESFVNSVYAAGNGTYNVDYAAKHIENQLDVTLKLIYQYTGESLDNAWRAKKVYLLDQRCMTEPVNTYVENNDNAMWPMPLFQMCPQYWYKGVPEGDGYWLENRRHGGGGALMRRDGLITFADWNESHGVVLCFDL